MDGVGGARRTICSFKAMADSAAVRGGETSHAARLVLEKDARAPHASKLSPATTTSCSGSFSPPASPARTPAELDALSARCAQVLGAGFAADASPGTIDALVSAAHRVTAAEMRAAQAEQWLRQYQAAATQSSEQLGKVRSEASTRRQQEDARAAQAMQAMEKASRDRRRLEVLLGTVQGDCRKLKGQAQLTKKAHKVLQADYRRLQARLVEFSGVAAKAQLAASIELPQPLAPPPGRAPQRAARDGDGLQMPTGSSARSEARDDSVAALHRTVGGLRGEVQELRFCISRVLDGIALQAGFLRLGVEGGQEGREEAAVAPSADAKVSQINAFLDGYVP